MARRYFFFQGYHPFARAGCRHRVLHAANKTRGLLPHQLLVNFEHRFTLGGVHQKISTCACSLT